MNRTLSVEWEREIGWRLRDEFSQVYYDAPFFALDHDKLGFLFLGEGTGAIEWVLLDKYGNLEQAHFKTASKVGLPFTWIIKQEKDSWSVWCNENVQFKITYSGNIMPAILPKEGFPVNDYCYVNKTYVFDQLEIGHKGMCGYTCTDLETKRIMWTVQTQGYLYTDIQRIDNRLFICTAGHGGFVYCIDLYTGEIRYQITTKGTAKIQFEKDFFVCYYLGKKGELLIVETETGQILQSLPLYTVGIHSPLLLAGDQTVYTLSFNRCDKQSWSAIISKVSVCQGDGSVDTGRAY